MRLSRGPGGEGGGWTAHPGRSDRFPISWSCDVRPAPAEEDEEDAEPLRPEPPRMQVRREAYLVAPFSHALHLFRPDPQRSICIGKRNHERLRAPGRGRPSGEAPGRRGRLRRGGRVPRCEPPACLVLGGRLVERSGAVCPRQPRAPFMRGGDLGAGRTGQQLSHGVAGCAGQGPVHPRTCEIRAQRPALSRALRLALREEPWAPGLRRGLGRGQRWPAALRPHLSPCRPLLASGPESAHSICSPSLTSARGWRHLLPPGLQPHCQGHRAPGRPPPPPPTHTPSGGRALGPSAAVLRGSLGVSRWAGALPLWGWSAGAGEGDPRLPARRSHALRPAGQASAGPAVCGLRRPCRVPLGERPPSAHRTPWPVPRGLLVPHSSPAPAALCSPCGPLGGQLYPRCPSSRGATSPTLSLQPEASRSAV